MPAHMGPQGAPLSKVEMTDRPSVLAPEPPSRDLSEHDAPKRLYCRNGGLSLRMRSSGAVDGVLHQRDAYTVLKLKAVAAGVVVIKGQESGRYLAMDKTGKLYASSQLNDECYFIEKLEENHYNTYRSQKYQDFGQWYVGLKKNGQTKSGPDTHKGQNAIYFLPIPV